MAENLSDGPRLNWKAIGETTDLGNVIDAIPPEEVIKRLGVPLALKTIGVRKIIEAVGQPKGFDPTETETLLKGLMSNFTSEQLQQMIREAKKT